MILKSRRLFYVPEWTTDPTEAPAAGLWARDTRFLDPIRVVAGGSKRHARVLEAARDRAVVAYEGVTITLTIGDELVCDVDAAVDGVFLTVTADFRDLFEVRGWKARRRGDATSPLASPGRLVLGYEAVDGHSLRTVITTDSSVGMTPIDGGAELRFPAPGRYRLTVGPDLPPGRLAAPSRSQASIRTGHRRLDALLARSAGDLASLQTDFPDGTLLAAGMPWYVAPFGRDALIGAWQTLHVDPDGAAATLRALAALQGKVHDPVTEEQPGRIIHEARYGELARLGEIPHHPYYGTVDATPLFLMVTAETLAWTADEDLAADLAPTMDAALRWVDTWGDADGDGLIEYRLEADPAAVPNLISRHQAWKDSADSLHHPDGTEPDGPIAAVEVQGYLHRALVALARLATHRGDAEQATELTRRATTLADRINRAFWMDDEHWYAQALDGRKRQVAAVASNGAQLLFSGIVPTERVPPMLQRMLRPDLFSGWGVRTLATEEPAYDPLSYHNGSVWPHDNGIIADGCYSTGHASAGEAIFGAMLELAGEESFAELYSGESGATAPEPVPGACRPQAWAAGVMPQLIRSCLGLRPAGDSLLIDPALPSFLDRVVIAGLTFQGSTGDLLVERDGTGYRIEAPGLPLKARPRGRT